MHLLSIIIALGFIIQSPETGTYPGPECLSEPGRSALFRTESVSFSTDNTSLSGTVYLPQKEGRYPAVVMVHGGGNNLANLRSTPVFMAEMMVRCGFAVIVYDKRGTGASEGSWADTSFDDFVEDVGSAGKLLSRDPEIDGSRIGLIGFSQGGRLAPLAAVRYPFFSWVISVSGPIAGVAETRLHALRHSYLDAGVSEEIISRVMPRWKDYFAALASGDVDRIQSVISSATGIDDGYNGSLLPPPRDRNAVGGIYNSFGRDYTSELTQLDIPWFGLFGELDNVIPIQVTVSNMELLQADNPQITIKVVPGVNHSFMGEGNRMHRFDLDVIDWAMKKSDLPIHPRCAHPTQHDC